MTATAVWADPVRVVTLGDSLTAGYGLRTEDGFVPQMQAWLDARGAEVELVNAGVSGDTSAGGLARVGWALDADVDGMILALGGNDYLRGLPPEAMAANLRGIVDAGQALGAGVMLVGLNVGSNYGPAYEAAFEAVYDTLAADEDLPLYADWFAGLQDAANGDGIGPYMQRDGIHPNAEGVALIVEAMGPAVLDFVASLDKG